MSGQSLVQEGISGGHELEHRPVLAHDAVDEQLGLAPEGGAEVLVETGEEPRVGLLGIDVAEEEPLLGEVADQRLRLGVDEHAPHLTVQNSRVAQVPSDGMVEELVIGDAAPEEERQPRRQLQIAYAVRAVRPDTLGVALDAKEKLRAHEETLNHPLDATLEASLGHTTVVEG